jgi:hypothetical protein
MLRVKVLKFGSNWWPRFGRDLDDPFRFSRHAAYYNSTGVRCGNKIRRHWMIPGLIRFNGVGDFNPNLPSRSVGQTFMCSELTFALGGNRILFSRKTDAPAAPDWYLVVVTSIRFGLFDFRLPAWKSGSVQPIAVSALREKQEAMLLMRPGDWIVSNLGFWQLRVRNDLLHGAALELAEEDLN